MDVQMDAANLAPMVAKNGALEKFGLFDFAKYRQNVC